jgi:hypothetical protein
LGLSNNSTPYIGYSSIEYLDGESSSFLNSYSLNYVYGTSVDYGNDRLDVSTGSILFQSNDGYNRTVYNSGVDYRTISSSVFFGSMVDGNYTKEQVMQQYLLYLGGDPEPNIFVEQYEVDFGIQFVGYPKTEAFRIVNTGLETLLINNISIDGDEFSYNGATSVQIPSYENIILDIIMNASSVGSYDGVLTIESNDPDQPIVDIDLLGSCFEPPILQIMPNELIVDLSTSQQHEEILIISNSGGYDLEFEIAASEITRDILWLDISPNSGILDPGNSGEISLVFDTSLLSQGNYFCELIISHNDPAQEEVVIPITLTVSALGTEYDLPVSTSRLIGNYPNPFNPTTEIRFYLDNDAPQPTQLIIYNSKGQKIKQLLDSKLARGEYNIMWDGTDDNGIPVSSGIFLYTLKTKNFQNSGKMVLLK